MRKSTSLHRKADTAIGSARDLVNAALAQLDLAAEHNAHAADAHRAALDYHSEQLSRTSTRTFTIQNLKNSLSG